MTLSLELSPAVESRLKAQAAACGLDLEQYVLIVVERAALHGVPGAATLALFKQWDAEDQTDDPAEIEKRQREFEEFKAAMNANRAGERPLFP